MENFKNELLNVLTEQIQKEVCQHIFEKFTPEITQLEVLCKLQRFIQCIKGFSDELDETHKVMIQKVTDDFIAGIEYWQPYLFDCLGKITFKIDEIPFSELLKYPVEGLEKKVDVIGDVIWELTIDGWTCEEQRANLDNYLMR